MATGQYALATGVDKAGVDLNQVKIDLAYSVQRTALQADYSVMPYRLAWYRLLTSAHSM